MNRVVFINPDTLNERSDLAVTEGGLRHIAGCQCLLQFFNFETSEIITVYLLVGKCQLLTQNCELGVFYIDYLKILVLVTLRGAESDHCLIHLIVDAFYVFLNRIGVQNFLVSGNRIRQI